MSDNSEFACHFRKIGTAGFVAFEIADILLRRKSASDDIMLGDLNDEFVGILTRLRNREVRFGFLSDRRGMDAYTYGEQEFLALVKVLDALLEVRGALPDFWIAGGPSERGEASIQAGGYMPPESAVRTIVHAMDWYGVDKRQALLVTPTATGSVAGIRSIQYVGGNGDRKTEANRLATTIEEIFGVERYTLS